MSEIYTDRVEASSKDGTLDLMGSMVHASQIATTGAGLSKSEILGNSFIFFLAGHETAANTLHFALLQLAMRPGLQWRLQAELDQILGKKPSPDGWDYDEDLPLLFGGLLGATMNETLRLISPVQIIPKSSPMPQTITLSDGRQATIPGRTVIGLNAHAVHRNPRVWPHDDRENGTWELDDYRPERWLLKTDRKKDMEFSFVYVKGEEESDLSPDTANTLFKPPKGAYIPFSEGPRACLGRRFAQVEILAVLAVLLKEHSFELFIDKDVSGLDGADKRKIWENARDDVKKRLRDEMNSMITIKLTGKPVKVRAVKRGEEIFSWDD
jgi:cytochrome P450